MGLSTGHRLPLAQAFSFDQNMPRAAHVAPVLGPQREIFGAPEQLTGKQQNPARGDKTGPRSGSASTGVAKKELRIANLMVENAAKLDRDTFGVAVGQGPWQRRLEEIGGIKPLAFGQFGEMGPGLEALLASMAKRGADEMADRYLIENREAAVGVQMFHMRQRWGAAVWRAQTQVLLGRLKYALPGWEEAESRRAADAATEASWRSHASGSGDGGGLGGDSSWGAGCGGDVGRVDRQ